LRDNIVTVALLVFESALSIVVQILTILSRFEIRCKLLLLSIYSR